MAETILILEDDDALRTALATALRECDYEVWEAARGEDAVEKAALYHFDLVIADIRMEGLTGLEALEKVKSNRPSTESMVITGYVNEEDSIKAVELGVRHYLRKPFELSSFLNAVEHALFVRQQEKDKQARELATLESLGWSAALSLQTRQPALCQAGEAAYTVCLDAGLPRRAALHSRLLCLLQGAELVGSPLPPFLQAALPPDLRATRESENLPALVARAALHEQGLEPSSPPLDEWLTVDLRAALEGLREQQSPRPPSLPRRSWGGQLSLARTLAEQSHNEASLTIYNALLEREGELLLSESVEAHLGLAQLHFSQRQMEQAQSLASLAYQRAARLGTASALAAMLEALLVLGPHQPERVRQTLPDVAQALSSVDPNAWARATLVLWSLGEEVSEPTLRRVLDKGAQPRLRPHLFWLLPALWRRDHSGALWQQAFASLLDLSPRTFAELLRGGQLEGPPELLLGLLAQVGTEEARLELEALASASPFQNAAQTALTDSDFSRVLPLQIAVCGGFEARLGDHKISDWKSLKHRSLFVYLLVRESRPTSEEMLAELFWPDAAPDRARHSLHNATSQLRKTCRAGEGGRPNPILHSRTGVSFNPEFPLEFDFEVVNNGLKALEAGQPSMEVFRRTAQSYRGAFFPECYMDWAEELRGHLSLRAVTTLTRLATQLVQSQSWENGLEVAQKALALDPCSQEACRDLMSAALALSRPEVALRSYERCRSALSRELELEPNMALFELYHRARLQV